jgi:hypothetical protein
MNYSFRRPGRGDRGSRTRSPPRTCRSWSPSGPEMLPLDLQAELHLRSDRTAIAYRKWLRQLGLKYGTA